MFRVDAVLVEHRGCPWLGLLSGGALRQPQRGDGDNQEESNAPRRRRRAATATGWHCCGAQLDARRWSEPIGHDGWRTSRAAQAI